MRVDQAFAKSGFEIVDAKRDKATNTLTFEVRVPLQNPIVPKRWKAMFEAVLLHAEIVMSKPTPKWSIDISKRFFARNGGLRYFWRIRISGDIAAASTVIVAATLDALRTGNELSSVPLVGSQTSRPDPANGKFKGAYPRGEDDKASHVVAAAFSVSVGAS